MTLLYIVFLYLTRWIKDELSLVLLSGSKGRDWAWTLTSNSDVSKSKPCNCIDFSSVQDIDIYFFTWLIVFFGGGEVGEFKYATWIFKGAKGVVMATKFKQK